ncbi:MAG: hypothetical protein JST16_03560 [Bdellovibrionales bacterium]|nr:hypothetical protein [Bdellovibrionales bacterium]
MESKFFSTATKVALAFSIGTSPCFAGSIRDFKGSLFCASSSGYGRNTLSSSLVANGAVPGGSKAWNSKALDLSKDEPNTKALRKWLSNYCGTDKRPTRSIKEYIRWIVPKVESGIPVDQATTLQKNWKAAATELAKEFFNFASFPSMKPESEASECSGDLNFYTLPLGAKKGDFFPNAPKIKPDAPASFMFFASASDANAPIYLASNTMTRFTMPANQLGSENKRTAYDPERTFKPGVTDSVAYLPHELGVGGLWVSPGAMTIQLENGSSTSTQTIYPLRPFLYGEAAILRNFFVLYMPQAEQRKILGETITRANSPSEFIQDQSDAWTKYFSKTTHFQESPSEDGRYIQFSVELELGPICQFAIPKDDLLSR